MGILILAAIGMLIYALQHCRRQKTEYIDEIVYKILKICQALQFIHEGKPLGMGAGCLNIQSKQITVAFPIKEAWIDSIILRPVLLGPPSGCERKAAVRRFFEILQNGIPEEEYQYIMAKGPELTGGILSSPTVMLIFEIRDGDIRHVQYYKSALVLTGRQMGLNVDIEHDNPYYDILFTINKK